ncbi:hypothetical protein REPUB_Repub19eG0015900 [Reevesia pubescens]
MDRDFRDYIYTSKQMHRLVGQVDSGAEPDVHQTKPQVNSPVKLVTVASQLECNGKGASPPATLAEFTIGSGTQDFYDVSLVDGYNLPMIVEPSGGSGPCLSTGCVNDLNRQCPNELRVGSGEACKSACEAFGTPEYCCSGAFATPDTCKPSVYSEMFKAACPRSYSYAYDDATSTFTCTGADYTITFCPSSTRGDVNV